jgi:hypothetical protein
MAQVGGQHGQRELIDEIRRKDYMIGLEMSSEVQEAATGLREKLGSALKLLAAELYSSDTHFLLELVQNADDNSYPAGVVPTINIRVASGLLVIFNNEDGFTEKNVRALCSVGSSTKAGQKQKGYIGEKGIGFKSVFQVSDRPEVHSNGFHFFFDVSWGSELLGYVIPHWKEPDTAVATVGTTILLPAKSGERFATHVFRGLHPQLMLFLNRLRRIELDHEHGRLTYHRHDSEHLISLTTEAYDDTGKRTSDSREAYMRVEYPVSLSHVREEKRDGVGTTDLVIAFPLDAEGRVNARLGNDLFAFLPVRDFGFRFYIQGDFLLSSGREDILEGRLWNQMLRDSIAPAFVQAVQQIRESRNVARGYLKYLPEGEEITHRFFVPVVDQLFSALAQTECIPCASGQWRKPADVMVVTLQFAKLFTPEDTLRLFGRDYPIHDLDVEQKQLVRLGCRELSCADVVSIFNQHATWLLEHDINWMLEFYRFVAVCNRKGLLDCELANAPVVLDTNGRLNSPAKVAIFYPLVAGKTFGFEQNLCICHDTIVEAFAPGQDALRSLFDELGVRRANPYQLIEKHILAQHRSSDWKSAGHDALIGHLRYVKELRAEYFSGAKSQGLSDKAAWERLRDGLWIGSKVSSDTGWTFAHAKDMYLSTEFSPDFDIEALLGEGVSSKHLVSPRYVETGGTAAPLSHEEIAEWRRFLYALGVNASPRLERLGADDLACSVELKRLLEHTDADVRRATLECLDRNWQSYPASTKFVPKGRYASDSRQYSFVANLRSTIAPARHRREARLDQSFQNTQELRDALGDTPNYVDADIKNAAFMDACGIRHRVDVTTCVDRLLQLKAGGHTDVADVRPVYRFMERLCDRDLAVVKRAFQINSIILTRATQSPWKNASEVVWSRQGDFLDRLYPSLQLHYGDFQTFFCRRLGISTDPATADLIRALPQLDVGTLSQEAKVKEVMRIYGKASHELTSRSGDNSLPAWLSEFASGRSFLTEHGRMVCNDGQLFVDDKPAIGALFRDTPNISFVAIPAGRLPQVSGLLLAAKVPVVSSSASLSVVPSGDEAGNPELTRRVRERLLLVARLIYAHSHAGFVRSLKAGKWVVLSNLAVVDVDNLVVRAELRGVEAHTTGDVLLEDGKVYVRKGCKGVIDRLAGEICTLLAVHGAIADGVSRILSEQEFSAAEEFLDVKDIPDLPVDERARLFDGASAADAEHDNARDDDGTSGTASPARSRGPAAMPGHRAASVPTVTGATVHAQRAGGSVVRSGGQSQPPVLERSAESLENSPATGMSGASAAPRPTGLLGVEGATPPTRQVGSRPMQFKPMGSRSSTLSFRHLGFAMPRRRDGNGGRRLVSYVEPSTGADSRDAADEEAIKIVERAAVDFFLKGQCEHWTSLEEMPPLNKGFDIRGISLDVKQYYIEIKGLSGAWSTEGIAMTPAEISYAAEHKDFYWLCVVEYALDENRRRLYIVKDPFGSSGQFRYDSGWKDVAISERASALTPAVGLKVDVDDSGAGVIVEIVKQGGLFSRVKIRFDNGAEVIRVFNPSTMRLSKED